MRVTAGKRPYCTLSIPEQRDAIVALKGRGWSPSRIQSTLRLSQATYHRRLAEIEEMAEFNQDTTDE